MTLDQVDAAIARALEETVKGALPELVHAQRQLPTPDEAHAEVELFADHLFDVCTVLRERLAQRIKEQS